jgi:hypothetical protein
VITSVIFHFIFTLRLYYSSIEVDMTNIFRSRYVTEEHISLHSSASKLGLHKDRFDGIDENQIES